MRGSCLDAELNRNDAAGNQHPHRITNRQRDAHRNRDANADPQPNPHPLHRDAPLPATA